MKVQVNGQSLYVDVEGSGLVVDGPRMRERPTVLLLHGGPGMDHTLFKPHFGEHLADVCQLVYVDHRGNGRSQPSDPITWNLEQWGEDVYGLCEVLGIEHPIVLGWSFGGFVAMSYVAQHPDHPAKLILQSTTARWDLDRVVEGFRREAGPDAGEAARRYYTEPSPEAWRDYGRLCYPAYSPQPPDPLEFARMTMNRELGDGFLVGLEMDLRAGLQTVTCPTLVAAGRHDPITPLGAAEEIVASLPPTLGRIEVFERSGHFIPSTEPERYFAAVREFVTGDDTHSLIYR